MSIKRHIAFLSLAIVPLTSVGAGMQFTIDNASMRVSDPIVMTDSVIALDERIIVSFTESIIDPVAYQKTVGCTPQEDLMFEWRDDNRLLHIIPRSIWQPDAQYSFAFPMGTDQQGLSQIFRFHTVAYPQILQSNTDDAKKIFSENDEIVLTFDQSIDQYDLQAVIRPHIATTQFIDNGTRKLRIVIGSEDGFVGGYHNITVFARHIDQKSDQFYPIAAKSFNTLLPMPDEWPKEFVERLEVAKKTTVPRIKNGKYIDVNLEAQVTTLFENGKYVASFVNSTGAKDTPTPAGAFNIYNKHPYALSGMFGVYLPYWMAFTENGEYGFHDLIVWPEGHKDMPEGGKESITSIGNAVSPGCVRHDAKNSKYIYDWADIGTPVIIY